MTCNPYLYSQCSKYMSIVCTTCSWSVVYTYNLESMPLVCTNNPTAVDLYHQLALYTFSLLSMNIAHALWLSLTNTVGWFSIVIGHSLCLKPMLYVQIPCSMLIAIPLLIPRKSQVSCRNRESQVIYIVMPHEYLHQTLWFTDSQVIQTVIFHKKWLMAIFIKKFKSTVNHQRSQVTRLKSDSRLGTLSLR